MILLARRPAGLEALVSSGSTLRESIEAEASNGC